VDAQRLKLAGKREKKIEESPLLVFVAAKHFKPRRMRIIEVLFSPWFFS